MRKYIFISIFLFYCGVVYGQISTNEEAISYRRSIPDLIINGNAQKHLPPLDLSKIEKEDEEDEANGVPPRFGYRHEVSYNLENSGEGIELSNGETVSSA